jgi:hypothetical protein
MAEALGQTMNNSRIPSSFAVTAILVLVAAIVAFTLPKGNVATVSSYIVQANSLEDARTAVAAIDGTITHELSIIKAVGAELNLRQVETLESVATLSVLANSAVSRQGVSDAEPFSSLLPTD